MVSEYKKYQCEICHKLYDFLTDAEWCENYHISNNHHKTIDTDIVDIFVKYTKEDESAKIKRILEKSNGDYIVVLQNHIPVSKDSEYGRVFQIKYCYTVDGRPLLEALNV